MADNKKSVILYCDLIHTIEKLDNETAGELFKHYLRYINDLNPSTENIFVDVVFEPIKRQLKRDLEKYEDKKDKKSTSGREGNLKRWNLDLYDDYKKGKHTLKGAEIIANSRKVSQPDKVPSQTVANIAVNDNVNVNDNDNDNVIYKTKTKTGFSFRKSLIELGIKENLVNDYLKNRKLKRLAETETAFRNLKLEFEKNDVEINELMELIIIRGWGSFKSVWLDNEKGTARKYSPQKDNEGWSNVVMPVD